ncbi:hypothetical protein HKB21_07040, partial [Vibrio parahaemolyticus]|nr:hypothetical protein [Vibrio parahaemolyticus]
RADGFIWQCLRSPKQQGLYLMDSDLIQLTIERLKDQSNGKPPWIDVKEIDSLTQLHEKKSALLRTPALFVFLVSDSPKPDVR